MIGSKLAHYEITAHIGSGGMGHVYQAADSKLGRNVAIKVLPDEFTRDAERIARLQREARVLASLNHPSIAAIYGLEEAGDRAFLVMELVPGETLADRIARGPLAAVEALQIAARIAGALEAAHESGVIHRDLKPANIKVTPAGGVKLLDFGLAKAYAAGRQASLAESPTLSVMTANVGTILGTAAYMSPEQAKGKELDRRTDIFSFGCVLYEMLTGRRAFAGETVAEILAQVIEKEPDWHRLPARLPARIAELLQRCLEKDPDRRRRDSGDIRIDLEQTLAAPLAQNPPAQDRRAPLAWTAAALLAAGLVAALTVLYLRAPAAAPEMRVEITTPSTADPSSFAISPDGRYVAFVASAGGSPRLWLRPIDGTAARPLDATDGARYPFWSPDSRSIGYFASGLGLQRIDIAGGEPRQLAVVAPGYGGAWGPDGTVVFAPTFGGGLARVSSAGGEATAITEPQRPQETSHRFPQFLPDGRTYLFHVLGTEDVQGIYVASLDRPGTKRRLLPADTTAAYLPSGWLLYARQGSLRAQRFDPAREELRGEAVVLAEGIVVADLSAAGFSASAGGLIGYRAGGSQSTRLTWFDRAGTPLGTMGGGDLANTFDPELSPDGTRVAVTRTGGNTDVWVLDAIRASRSTYDSSVDRNPVWSPDGSRLVFASNRISAFDLFTIPSSGGGDGQLLVGTTLTKSPSDWSPDGRFVMYLEVSAATAPDLWVRPLASDGVASAWLATRAVEVWGQFSPDGRWVAYQSDESGRTEIYVRPFPGPGGQWPISAAGGVYPRWSPDGSELYYIAPNGALMAVAIGRDDASVNPAAPVELFRPSISGGGGAVPGRRAQYDVGPDGRFLVNVANEQALTPITLILNWRPPAE